MVGRKIRWFFSKREGISASGIRLNMGIFTAKHLAGIVKKKKTRFIDPTGFYFVWTNAKRYGP